MLRGIDSQIAIQRLNDYTKDTSAALRQSELQHDFQAQLGRAMAERQHRQVQTTAQKQNAPAINPDERGGGGRQDPRQGRKRQGAQQNPLLHELDVTPQRLPVETHKYDIEA